MWALSHCIATCEGRLLIKAMCTIEFSLFKLNWIDIRTIYHCIQIQNMRVEFLEF